MNLDGSDRQVISKTHYYFHQATKEGIVIALYGKGDAFFEEYVGANIYFAPDPYHPTFDPEQCEKRTISGEDYDFIFGEYFYHRADVEEDEYSETVLHLSELSPD